MRAVQFTEYGGPEVLHIADIEQPRPGPREILIAVVAAGVNGLDWKTRAGYLRDFRPVDFPSGTGGDAAGRVVAVGDSVEHPVSVGDEVFGSGRNTLAEYAVLTSWVKKPASVSFEEAAGYPLPAETAVRMLRLAGVKKGDTVLVNGASGGVGSAVVQLAADRGAFVIGVASEPNHDYLRSIGAVPITYGPGLIERARSAGGPVHAALDVAGSGVLPELVELTGDPKRVVTIADFSGADLGIHTTVAAEDYFGALELVAGLAARGSFTIPVARSFALADAGAAHASVAKGHIAGRTVVTI